MDNQKSTGFFSNIKQDLPASLVVFLVALPLCLGIALASGAPLFSGIIAGIVGGTIVALLSGSPLGVSGPAAGLAVIVLGAIQSLGYEVFLFAVVIAGFFQIGLGLLKAGVIGYYFPSSVIKGMLSGIGVIIILKQIPHAFGYDADPEGDLAFSQVDGHNTFSELAYMLDAVSPGALIIALISLAILILWDTPFMKKLSFTSIIPGPLVAVGAGVGLNVFFAKFGNLALSAEQVVSIPVATSVSDFIGQFTLPDFNSWNNLEVYVTAATIAVVASLETLLCVEATDKLDPQKRITPTNRELLAQGTGNIVSGFIGGLPITQVIVRSSANIQSGGQSKASAFIHGILLLVTAISIPGILNLIPLSSLAAILFIVGYKLAKPAIFKQMYKMGNEQFVPFVVTIAFIVFTDLLTGIGIGLVVAIVYILWNNFKRPYHVNPDEFVVGEPIVIVLSEEVTFLNKAGILNTLEQIPEGMEVVIDGSRNKTIHPDVLEIFDDYKLKSVSRDIKFTVRGLTDDDPVDPVKQLNVLIKEEAESLN